MGDRTAYYKDWYEGHKGELSEKRKHSYDSDPAYRDKVLSQSARYREQQRAIPRLRVSRHHVPREYVAGDGGKIVLFSIGAMAIYIQRSVQSIGQWERSGVIPQTPYRAGKRGFRFYTREMMDAVKAAVGNKRRLYPVDQAMTDEIRRRWVTSGVPVGCDGGIEEAICQTRTQVQ
jgi:hypothetical protein